MGCTLNFWRQDQNQWPAGLDTSLKPKSKHEQIFQKDIFETFRGD